MNDLTISLVQMDCRLGEPKHNFERAAYMVEEAARRGSDLVVLPELWSSAYDLEHADRHATPLESDNPNDAGFGEFSLMAQEFQVWLTGSLLEKREGAIYNTMALFDPAGELAGAYSKIHLFQLMDEHHHLAAGEKMQLLDMPWGKSGCAICYDLRFPELFRRYALDGARMVILPAEWPHPRRMHWRTLLRARAIENQIFVVACNRVGESKGTKFCGSSAVIDPWGQTLIEGGEEETILTVTISPADVEKVRERIPIFADRRPHLYS